MAIDLSVMMPQGGGMFNPGSQDMTPEQNKMMMLGLLSNAFTNIGNLGAGSQQESPITGLLSMQTMFNNQNQQANRAKKMQEAFSGAMVRDPVQTPGYSVGSNWAKDQPTAQFMADQNRSINEMNDQPASPGMGMAETFGLNDYADLFPRAPQESEAMVPEEKTTLGDPRFDMSKAAQGMMTSGDPELMMTGLKMLPEAPGKTEFGVTPFVDDQGKAWLIGKDGTVRQTGIKGRQDGSYKERTVSPDGQTYIKQYSLDGGRTWQQIEGTQPYDIRSASGSSEVTVNGFPKETFKNERDLRNDFQGLPTTKAFREVQTSYDQIRFALNNPSAANDLAAATKFMKLLDPGSVVRESELGMAMAATGQLDRMGNYYNMLKTGQKLTPAQRIDFYNSANGLYKAATNRYNESATEFRTMAQDYQLNPDRIAKPAAAAEQQDAQPTATDKLTPSEQTELEQLRKRFGK